MGIIMGLKLQKKQKYFLILFLLYFILSIFPLCFARQIRKPNTFIDKLINSLKEYDIDEAIQPGFFSKNWMILAEGIKVNFEAKGFLEIRRLEECIILQLFGELSQEDERKFSRFGEYEFSYNIQFVDFSYIDLEKEPVEVYSILKLNEEDFEIVIKDILKGGNGSGSIAIGGKKLEHISNMAKAIIFAAQKNYRLFNSSNFHVDKGSFIFMCENARRKVVKRIRELLEELGVYNPDIIDEVIVLKDEDSIRQYLVNNTDIEETANVEGRIVFLKSLRDTFKKIQNELTGEKGDIIYRVLYREFLRKILIIRKP